MVHELFDFDDVRTSMLHGDITWTVKLRWKDASVRGWTWNECDPFLDSGNLITCCRNRPVIYLLQQPAEFRRVALQPTLPMCLVYDANFFFLATNWHTSSPAEWNLFLLWAFWNLITGLWNAAVIHHAALRFLKCASFYSILPFRHEFLRSIMFWVEFLIHYRHILLIFSLIPYWV